MSVAITAEASETSDEGSVASASESADAALAGGMVCYSIVAAVTRLGYSSH